MPTLPTVAEDIVIPPEWSTAAEAIAHNSAASPPPVTVVCGAKNSGKTTFSRHLLNVLLQRYKRVAYLDTDVGQTEFTPPGFLSLIIHEDSNPDLAVPCLKTPERCYFFGDTSSKRDPEMYLTFVSALYDHYRTHYNLFQNSESPSDTAIPLIVNTPGWVKGIGYDILVDMLKHITPSHVVKINISVESKNLPSGAFWLGEWDAEAVNLVEINSARQDSLNRSVLVQKDARLLRDLRLMAYFRQIFPSEMASIKGLARALCAHPPYAVPFSTVKYKHLHAKVPEAQVFYALNATIVGLAVSSEGSEDCMPPCRGLGIVRAIDTSKPDPVLYLLTPVPPEVLRDVDLLLQGFIQIPSCLLTVEGCTSPYVTSSRSNEGW